MPSPSEPLIDERFRELAAVLRDARPRPSERLRERVRELAETPVEPARGFRMRRLVRLALAVAALGGPPGGPGGGFPRARAGAARDRGRRARGPRRRRVPARLALVRQPRRPRGLARRAGGGDDPGDGRPRTSRDPADRAPGPDLQGGA